MKTENRHYARTAFAIIVLATFVGGPVLMAVVAAAVAMIPQP